MSEVEKITGVARFAGWRKKRGKERFIVEIELMSGPHWPIDVVWKQTPITLSLETQVPPDFCCASGGKIVSFLTKRPISHSEAREAAQRLINSHFGNQPHARTAVPPRPDYDDDMVLCAYIAQQREKEIAAPAMLAALKAIVHPDNEAICYFVPSDSWAMKLRQDCIDAIAKAEDHVPVAPQVDK